MLFVFYILVFLNINYAEISCFALKQNKLDGETNNTNTTNMPDLIPNNATTRHFFKMIQNLTSTKTIFSNLKSNVFDKMLSEEMLSIKEHLFEKDLSQVSLLLSTNGNAPTPTLEIKQKWPFAEYDSVENDNKNKSIYQIVVDSRDDAKDDNGKTVSETDKEEKSNKKVVGLRSLSLEAHSHAPILRTRPKITHKNDSTSNKGSKLCTCAKLNNPSVACSHRSDSSCKCGINDPKECTRLFQTNYPIVPLSMTVPMYTYATYPTFLVEISTLSPYRDYFYHPNVLDDIKLPRKHKKHKHKHKTSKKIDLDSLYYDNSKEGFFKGYDDDEIDDDNYASNTKPSIKKDENKVIINIDYEVRDVKGNIPKTTIAWENGYIEHVIKEKLVNDMVKDLKQQYADAVLKDCYCSALSLHSSVANIPRVLLTVLALLWIFNNLNLTFF